MNTTDILTFISGGTAIVYFIRMERHSKRHSKSSHSDTRNDSLRWLFLFATVVCFATISVLLIHERAFEKGVALGMTQSVPHHNPPSYPPMYAIEEGEYTKVGSTETVSVELYRSGGYQMRPSAVEAAAKWMTGPTNLFPILVSTKERAKGETTISCWRIAVRAPSGKLFGFIVSEQLLWEHPPKISAW